LIIGVNRSKREPAQLPPSRAKVRKERTCPHSVQGASSYLDIENLQHIYIYIYIYIYIMCSVFNYCDRNVYFTKMSRTQVTDDFVETFEQSVLKLSGFVTQ